MTKKSAASLMIVEVERILPNPDQPRQEFDLDALNSLAESIKTHGVLQPVSLRGPYQVDGQEWYYLIDGERRWRAAKIASLNAIPAQVFDPELMDQPSDEVNIELALIGNMQRQNMNVVEEALAFKKLRDQCGYGAGQIGQVVGLSIATVYSRLMIADLEAELHPYFVKGALPVDYDAVKAMTALPGEVRLKLLPDLARRNVKRPTFLRVVKEAVNQSLHEKKPVKRPAESKSLSFSSEPDVRKLTLLEKESKLPGWSLIEEASKETCDACSLNGGSDALCAGCPAAELIKRIANKVNKS